MTKNQKIALGCGGAGCLGLIVVVIAAGLFYFFSYRRWYSTNREYNFNVSTNRNSNRNGNANSNANGNSSTSTSASSLSDDDKHKLWQAASMTGDGELIRRVSVKIGILNEDYTQGDDYQTFVGEHIGWALHNGDFIQSVGTPEKARAYVNEHFPE
jgi:hypothetical protein